jgi:RNA polymerase sigma-70 factor (sigma-E family)
MTTEGRMAAGAGEDEALSRLYQQVTDLQAAWFSADYDVDAGLARFRAWLRQLSVQDATAARRSRAGSVPARQISPAAISAAAALPTAGAAVIALRIAGGSAAIRDELDPGRTDRDLDRLVTELYADHYRPLVRLAALLVGDIATAEEIAQDAFVALHNARRTPDSDSALSYLRRAVLARSRAAIRHRMPAGVDAAESGRSATGAEQHQPTSREYQAIISALSKLPTRQREAIVLRYCADLSEAQIAAAMGISRGAVKSHTARATASLRAISQDEHH